MLFWHVIGHRITSSEEDRRSAAGLGPDGLLRRCTGQGRTEDHALSGPPRGCSSGTQEQGLILRLDETWQWVDDLSNAFVKLRAAIP